MDEQTRLNLEQRLEDVLRRDLGAIPVRPFAMYNQSPRAATVHPIRRVFSLAGAAAVIAVVILVGLAAAFALRELKPTPATVPVPSSTPSGSPSPSSAASAQPSATASSAPAASGVITGMIGYPAGFLPALTVYAISTADSRTSFFVERPRFAEGQGPNDRANYSITGVAPGTYYVFAWRNSDPSTPDQPGLYSQFVLKCVQPTRAGASPPPECGSVRTGDHSLVPVTVRAGETVAGIDVSDWLYGQASYPPRPAR